MKLKGKPSHISANQLRLLQAKLKGRFKDREERLAFYRAFCHRSLDSSLDLSFEEAQALLHYLMKGERNPGCWGVFDKHDKQHRAILSLCQQYGWERPHEKWGYTADLGRLDGWLKSKRAPVQKPLKAMTKAELSKTLSALQAMVVKKYQASKTKSSKHENND